MPIKIPETILPISSFSPNFNAQKYYESRKFPTSLEKARGRSQPEVVKIPDPSGQHRGSAGTKSLSPRNTPNSRKSTTLCLNSERRVRERERLCESHDDGRLVVGRHTIVVGQARCRRRERMRRRILLFFRRWSQVGAPLAYATIVPHLNAITLLPCRRA